MLMCRSRMINKTTCSRRFTPKVPTFGKYILQWDHIEFLQRLVPGEIFCDGISALKIKKKKQQQQLDLVTCCVLTLSQEICFYTGGDGMIHSVAYRCNFLGGRLREVREQVGKFFLKHHLVCKHFCLSHIG